MKRLHGGILLGLVMSVAVMAWAHDTPEATENTHQQSVKTGGHGGRLLTQGAITLELLLFERGMPPHFRAYVYEDGKWVAPDKAGLTLELTRFNHKKETLAFIPAGTFLQSSTMIEEPHSFDVAIQLTYQGHTYDWHYASYEGRVKLVTAVLNAAGIAIAEAKPRLIRTRLKVVGKIVPNRDTMLSIYARYPGIIQSMTKNLGDEVAKGDVLVTIESNDSLQNYTIVSPMTGTIVQKYATNGELAQNTKPIYEVANLTNVWADFTLYRKEASLVKQGMAVQVTGDEGKPESSSTIAYIAPLGIEDSQTTLARAVLLNTTRSWLPGMYVNGAIVIQSRLAPVAVRLSAIQRINGHPVVFVQQGDYFEATPVSLGEKDEAWVAVRAGLDAGAHYVSQNSFFLKAELGKAGASHEH